MCYEFRVRAVDVNVLMVACTLKHTVPATESSQYDCFRKHAAYIDYKNKNYTQWGRGGGMAPLATPFDVIRIPCSPYQHVTKPKYSLTYNRNPEVSTVVCIAVN